MTNIHVSLKRVDYGQVTAVVATDEAYHMSRRFLEDLVLQEIAVAAGVSLPAARGEWDFDTSARYDSELPGKKAIRVIFKRHNPEDDLIQKKPFGSYALTFERLSKRLAEGE
jgi:hypothetical protein